jgi:hypothetical protein
MDLNGSKKSLEALIKIERNPAHKSAILAKLAAERLEAARLAKAIRPVFIVVPLSGNVAANDVKSFAALEQGYPVILQGQVTDQFLALMNIKDSAERSFSLSGSPTRPQYLAGDIGAGTNITGVTEIFNTPQAKRLRGDQHMIVTIKGFPTVLNQSLDNTYVVFRGVRVYPDDSAEARLNETERETILSEIAQHDEQETRIIKAPIDYTVAAGKGATDIPTETTDRSVLVLGIATNLQHSLVSIEDPFSHQWSRDPIPSLALAANSFANGYNGARNFYHFFSHPYLLMANRFLKVTATKRAAAGGYPVAYNEVDTGEVEFITRGV